MTPPRRRVRTLAAPWLVALSAAVALTLAAGPAVAATPVTDGAVTTSGAVTSNAQAARFGAGYLARQIEANGGYLAPFGPPDLGDTAYAVVGLTAAGVGRDASALAVTYLKSQVAHGLVDSSGADDAGALANVILAASAAGADPRAFGGSAPVNNLVARLLGTKRATGADRGLFGTASPTFDGAFRQGLALAALRSAGIPQARVDPALAWLTRQQCANGMWTSYRPDTSVPCPAADPDTFAGPDTNSTALAVQGLAAYGSRPRRAAMLTTLEAIQAADGGFPYFAAAGQSSDPNSTAVTIQALVATHAGPATARWVEHGRTPYAALAAFQLGCGDAAADRGAYYFPGSRTADILATIQAVPAQVGAALPVPHRVLAPSTPTLTCPPAA
ncbi:MAG: prenyltransferase/squalene oxidase repeat-containing protein [Lapillicoccus sp.]